MLPHLHSLPGSGGNGVFWSVQRVRLTGTWGALTILESSVNEVARLLASPQAALDSAGAAARVVLGESATRSVGSVGEAAGVEVLGAARRVRSGVLGGGSGASRGRGGGGGGRGARSTSGRGRGCGRAGASAAAVAHAVDLKDRQAIVAAADLVRVTGAGLVAAGRLRWKLDFG